MRGMNDKRIAHLESQLERLVEGAFVGIFGRRISAHDLAVKLARSLESNLQIAQDGDNRPVAPDQYTIHLHPAMQRKLLETRPQLTLTLSQHVTELVNLSGYHLVNDPLVRVIADAELQQGDVIINAIHREHRKHSTAVMQQLYQEQPITQPSDPFLIIDGRRRIPINEPLLNIGRSDENHIIVDDPFISRHHLQIRLRFGVYTLFDVNSRSGTFVNDVRVMQHKLRSGDVIRIGNSRIVYLADEPDDDDNAMTRTDTIEPVE